MKCPNCDFIDKDEAFGQPSICPKCGAIYEKALRLRELKKMHAKKLQASAEKKAKEQQAQEQAAEKKEPDRAAEEAAAEQRSHLPRHVQERIDARAKGDEVPSEPVGIFEHIAQGVDQSRAERQREADEIASRGTQEVVITDVKIPFLSLTVLLFKIMVAAIPAAIAFYIFMLIVLGAIK